MISPAVPVIATDTGQGRKEIANPYVNAAELNADMDAA
jgi:hypothetical protein